MSYQNFLTTLKEGLSTRLDSNVKLEIRSFPRNNNTSYDGLVIMNPNRNVSPTIYLPPYYHRYLEGVPLADIYEDILCTYEKHLPDEDFDTSLFTDYEKAASRIVMRLISFTRNETMLQNVPFFRFHDLAVVFYCMVFTDGVSQANILIHNEHLSLWGVGTDELYHKAMENTTRLLPPEVTPLSRILQECGTWGSEDLTDLELPMFILSNASRTNGATTLLYDGLLTQIAGWLDSDLMILPSSVHEVILVPVSEIEEMDFSHYNSLVQEVNETQLTDDEILSDHAYLFSRADNVLSIPCI